MTKTWDKTVIDRTEALKEWVAPVRALVEKGVPVYGYFNGHHSGHAPADMDLFRGLW